MKKANGIVFVSQFKQKEDALKPREKLEQFGPQSLALWELLALVLRTGERHKGGHFEDVAQLSKRLLSEAGFKGIFAQDSVDRVCELHNTYKSHAQTLVAISEIARRLHGKYDVFDAKNPEKIFEQFRFLQKAKQEQCFVLHIDRYEKCVFQEMVAIGTKAQVQVTPSDVLRSALWLGAEKLVVIHNHPGSSSAPSKADVSWTLALKKGFWDMHKIDFSDHIIVGKEGYFSFQESGLV